MPGPYRTLIHLYSKSWFQYIIFWKKNSIDNTDWDIWVHCFSYTWNFWCFDDQCCQTLKANTVWLDVRIEHEEIILMWIHFIWDSLYLAKYSCIISHQHHLELKLKATYNIYLVHLIPSHRYTGPWRKCLNCRFVWNIRGCVFSGDQLLLLCLWEYVFLTLS